MTSPSTMDFDRLYQSHLKHLKLKGLQPKTIEAYARAIRRAGAYFGHRLDALTAAQLTDYFSDLLASHSWSAVKLDLYPKIRDSNLISLPHALFRVFFCVGGERLVGKA